MIKPMVVKRSTRPVTEAARRKKGVLLTIGEAPEVEPGIGQKGQSAGREKYARGVGRGGKKHLLL
jgi:hypothetical protein